MKLLFFSPFFRKFSPVAPGCASPGRRSTFMRPKRSKRVSWSGLNFFEKGIIPWSLINPRHDEFRIGSFSSGDSDPRLYILVQSRGGKWCNEGLVWLSAFDRFADIASSNLRSLHPPAPRQQDQYRLYRKLFCTYWNQPWSTNIAIIMIYFTALYVNLFSQRAWSMKIFSMHKKYRSHRIFVQRSISNKFIKEGLVFTTHNLGSRNFGVRLKSFERASVRTAQDPSPYPGP